MMDSRMSSWMSGSCSPSMLMVPLVWNPPMMTSIPWARNCLPRSRALGNWLVWTPTRQTTSLVPGWRLLRTIRLTGTFSAVSSNVSTWMAISPRTRRLLTSSVRPWRTFRLLPGRTPRQKRTT